MITLPIQYLYHDPKHKGKPLADFDIKKAFFKHKITMLTKVDDTYCGLC